MATAWRRFAYACEFLLAIIAVFAAWGQIGGQGHLDLMPWYAKLLLSLGLSAAVVGLTGAIAERDRALNRRAVAWAMLVVVLAAAMGAATFYCHLHEAVDEPDEEGTTAHASLVLEC